MFRQPISIISQSCLQNTTQHNTTKHMRMLSLPPAQPATLTRNNSVLAHRPLRVAACS